MVSGPHLVMFTGANLMSPIRITLVCAELHLLYVAYNFDSHFQPHSCVGEHVGVDFICWKTLHPNQLCRPVNATILPANLPDDVRYRGVSISLL